MQNGRFVCVAVVASCLAAVPLVTVSDAQNVNPANPARTAPAPDDDRDWGWLGLLGLAGLAGLAKRPGYRIETGEALGNRSRA